MLLVVATPESDPAVFATEAQTIFKNKVICFHFNKHLNYLNYQALYIVGHCCSLYVFIYISLSRINVGIVCFLQTTDTLHLYVSYITYQNFYNTYYVWKHLYQFVCLFSFVVFFLFLAAWIVLSSCTLFSELCVDYVH